MINSQDASYPIGRQRTGLAHPHAPNHHQIVGYAPKESLSQARPQSTATAGSSSIGAPVSFLGGLFAGTTIRAELRELQKADRGRRYAKKDRRPLDPPPVVQLRLFQVFNMGTTAENEQEIDAEDSRSIGLVCCADLYSIPEGHQSIQSVVPPSATDTTFPDFDHNDIVRQGGQVSDSASHPDFNSSQSTPNFQSEVSAPSSSSTRLIPEVGASLYFPPAYPTSWSIPAPVPSSPAFPSPSSPSSSPQISALRGPQPRFADSRRMSISSAGSDDFAHFPMSKNSCCTDALVGSKSVAAACVELHGKSALLFVYSDLAVRVEGTFVLRYRVFDIFSRATNDCPHPALAESFSGPFKIYSTKTFPGLHASTALTKHLSHLGVKISYREHEREHKRRPTNETSHLDGQSPVAIAPVPPSRWD